LGTLKAFECFVKGQSKWPDLQDNNDNNNHIFCKKLKNPHLIFKFFMLGEGTPFQFFLGFWAQPQAMASAGPSNPGRAPK
jgi:hypothetical protein